MSRSLIVVPAGGRLPPGQRAALAAEILLAYVAARYHQRGHTLPDALKQLRAVPVRRRGVTDPVMVARRLGHAVIRTISPLPSDSRCLSRSLVLARLLARRGLEGRVVLGVSGADCFEAHAWVELEGVPVLAPGGTRFERLVEL